MPFASFAVGLSLMILAGAVFSWRARRKRLAGIRDAWSRPIDRKREMEAIDSYFRSRTDRTEALDDRTWHDLTLNDVFARLDRTVSTIGQQVLYDRLRSAHSASRLASFEALMTLTSADAGKRERTQLALAHLQDPAGYDLWAVAQPGAVERRRWHVVYPILGATMIVLLALAFVWPGLLLVALGLAIVNIVGRAVATSRVMALVGPFRQVSALIAVAERVALEFETEHLALLDTLRADLKALVRLKRIVRSVGPVPMASGEIGSLLMEYLNLVFLLDVNAIYFGANELRRCAPALLRVIEAVGEVDASIAVASYRAGTSSWTRPRFLAPGSPAVFAALSHPLLAAPVANSLSLLPGDGALITGSNMSGKTTFIRTVGVNVVLAQTVNTVMAERYEAPTMHVRSCIGSADDLLTGKSYYLAELEGVMGLVHASALATPHIFLLDELFRGTNAIERIAGAEAVLLELLRAGAHRKPHCALAATHDGELVGLLADVYTPYYFGDRLGDDGLAFDYALRPGVTATRNALALLRLHGAPPAMVDRAIARAAEMDRVALE